MRKILLIICAILTTTSTYATQMCARRNTTVVPLDGLVKADNYYSNPNEWFWYDGFAYGRIYGVATCLSVPEIQEYVPEWDGTRVAPFFSGADELQGRSGDYVASDGTVYPRKYCCGKMTHPMSSQWLCLDVRNSSDDCLNRCVNSGYGADQYGYQQYNRVPMFNSIGIGYIEIDTNEYGESIDLN